MMWGMTSGALNGLGYPIHQHRLDNGLRVIASPDHVAPSVAVNLWYDVGSRHEQPGRTGFAHLFEHVMFQGSAHVASPASTSGCCRRPVPRSTPPPGSIGPTTSRPCPTGGLDLALWLEADRLALCWTP